MICTEYEAKTKWCPFARELGDGEVSYNRNYEGKPETKCIGSACMAWRWARKPNPEWKPEPVNMMSYPPRDTRNDPPMYIADETRGFCGLSGRPE